MHISISWVCDSKIWIISEEKFHKKIEVTSGGYFKFW